MRECWQRGPEQRGGERKNPALRKNIPRRALPHLPQGAAPPWATAPVWGAEKVLPEMCQLISGPLPVQLGLAEGPSALVSAGFLGMPSR